MLEFIEEERFKFLVLGLVADIGAENPLHKVHLLQLHVLGLDHELEAFLFPSAIGAQEAGRQQIKQIIDVAERHLGPLLAVIDVQSVRLVREGANGEIVLAAVDQVGNKRDNPVDDGPGKNGLQMFLLNVLERPSKHGGEIRHEDGVTHFQVVDDVDFPALSLNEFV